MTPSERREYHRLWRLARPEKRNRERKAYYDRYRSKKAKLRVWTLQEVNMITRKNRPPDRIIHKKINRSVAAIQVKRHRLVCKLKNCH